jgi:hypothetical protein
MTDLTSEYNVYEAEKDKHVEAIKQIIIDSNESPEGNIFMSHFLVYYL